MLVANCANILWVEQSELTNRSCLSEDIRNKLPNEAVFFFVNYMPHMFYHFNKVGRPLFIATGHYIFISLCNTDI